MWNSLAVEKFLRDAGSIDSKKEMETFGYLYFLHL